MKVIFNKLGTYTSTRTRIIEVPSEYGGVMRTTIKGTDIFKVTNPSPDSFGLSMTGSTRMTSNAPAENVPLPGTHTYDSTIKVVDENTFDDNGIVFRRARF